MLFQWRNGSMRLGMLSLTVIILSLASVGCGKGSGDVTGKVTYRNKPLPFGWVRAQGSDGVLRDGKIEANGTYAIEGIPAGEAKFTVSCVDPKIEQYTKE